MNTLSSRSQQFSISGICTSLVVAILAVVLANWHGTSLHTLASVHFAMSDVIFAVIFAFAWQYCASLCGIYTGHSDFILRDAFRVFLCSLAMTGLLGAYIANRHVSDSIPRKLVMFLCAAFFLGLIMPIIRRAFERPQRVIIFGSGRLASKAWRELRTRDRVGKLLVGFVDAGSRAEMPPDIADRYVGDMDSLQELIVAKEVDELIAAVPLQSEFDSMQRASSIAQALGTRVVGLKDVCAIRNVEAADSQSEIFIELVPSPSIRGFKQDLKRMLDVIISAAGLLIGLPILIATVTWSRLRSIRPLTESQQMVGFRRKHFVMHSFRFQTETLFQRVGINRLPQLWNVLLGDMSLVGPPPLSTIEISQMDVAALECRFNMRPGLISEFSYGRSLEKDTEEQSLGSEYVSSWSLLGDLKILAKAFTIESRGARVAGTQVDTL